MTRAWPWRRGLALEVSPCESDDPNDREGMIVDMPYGASPTDAGTSHPINPTAPTRRSNRLSIRGWMWWVDPEGAKLRRPRRTHHRLGREG